MKDGVLHKALLILKRLAADKEPLRVKQLADGLSLNISTVQRVLQMLVDEGMVQLDADTRQYSIGQECLFMAANIMGRDSLLTRIGLILKTLSTRLEETCAFSLYDPLTQTKVISVIEQGPHALGYAFDIGQRDGIHAGASGKAILALLPDAEVDEFMRTAALERLTNMTIVNPLKLRAEVLEIRKMGYAVSHSERVSGGGSGIAAPVFGADGRVIGAIGTSIPVFRFREDRVPDIGNLLVHAAAEASNLNPPTGGETVHQAERQRA